MEWDMTSAQRLLAWPPSQKEGMASENPDSEEMQNCLRYWISDLFDYSCTYRQSSFIWILWIKQKRSPGNAVFHPPKRCLAVQIIPCRQNTCAKVMPKTAETNTILDSRAILGKREGE